MGRCKRSSWGFRTGLLKNNGWCHSIYFHILHCRWLPHGHLWFLEPLICSFLALQNDIESAVCSFHVSNRNLDRILSKNTRLSKPYAGKPITSQNIVSGDCDFTSPNSVLSFQAPLHVCLTTGSQFQVTIRTSVLQIARHPQISPIQE